MPKLSSKDYESHLRTRHRIALAFAQGDLGSSEYADAAKKLEISKKDPETGHRPCAWLRYI